MPGRLILLLVGPLLLPISAPAQTGYTNFETVPVRPLALSPDGQRLFATNTPDGRLEVFDVEPWGLLHRASVSVGVDPVAVAARTDTEVWVVNHLSDSVSIVDVGSEPPRVVRTLHVGDEPWDLVFAGPRASPADPFPRAFLSAARRGQNHPEDPHADLKEPGVGRADVWVFAADDLGTRMGGEPETIVRLFGDKPRPLAVSPDGSTVYAGIFHSGNQTATVNTGAVCDGGASRGPCTIGSTGVHDPPAVGEPGTGSPPVLPGGLPAPNVDADGVPQVETGLIVRWDGEAGEWRDELGRNWNGAIPFDLPDLDVFALDALGETPAEAASWASVGTLLFAMAVHPSGRVYVANTEARNEVRFEGPGTGTTSVRGRLHLSRVTVLDEDGGVRPRHVNKHIDYDVDLASEAVRDLSLASPSGLAFSHGGARLYLAALGSDAIGVFDVDELDADTFVPRPEARIELSGQGPAGLLTDESSQRLYVYTRFDNAVAVIDLWRRREIDRVPLANPEPEVVRAGRRFLYDARLSSSNGEAACASCHPFGDKDDLAWDLGNPFERVVPNPNPFLFDLTAEDFHPLKGPMTTQTLRGLDNHGPMHWRGDRTGAADPEVRDAFDEVAGFRAFNGAFESLLGRAEPLADAEMQAFAEFAMTIFPPPNPIRALDNIDRGPLAEARRTFFDVNINIATCDGCHRLDPANGKFGTPGLSVFDPGDFKVPHLRNVYDKVGAFGLHALNPPGNAGSAFGDQIRGFGLLHDGSIGDISTFFTLAGFIFPDGPAQKAVVEDFVLAFPSNMAPMVGQQVTRTPSSGRDAARRARLMLGQARASWIVPGNQGTRACDLVVKGVVDGEARGWVFRPGSNRFFADRAADPPLFERDLAALSRVPGQELTYTCVPPGSGERVGIDRDADGSFDRDELDLGTDPAAAGSVLGACSDGIDNDGDGAIDFGGDPDCASAGSHSELPGRRARIEVRPETLRAGRVLPIRVALLGSETFRVERVDLESLSFGPGAASPRSVRLRRSRRDLDGDGHADLVVRFGPADAGLQPGDDEACLEGVEAGESFRACDAVEVLEAPTCAWWDWRCWLRRILAAR